MSEDKPERIDWWVYEEFRRADQTIGERKVHVYTDKEIIKLAENEIESLRKEVKELGQMYANKFAKLRDLEAEMIEMQKKYSDQKANLGRAYNGIKYEKDKNAKLKLGVTKALELLEGNPTWTIDELHKYLKSVSE